MNENIQSVLIQYVSQCDETQILCVLDIIENVGIIWESEQSLIVQAILTCGTELIIRGFFERYKSLVMRHQSLLISNFTNHNILEEIIEPETTETIFLTVLNLLQHDAIFNQCPIMTTLRTVVLSCFNLDMNNIFSDYIFTCDKKQFISTSVSLQYIWQGINDPYQKRECLVIFWKRILELGCTDQFKDFIADNKDFILSIKDTALDIDSYYKTDYCNLLFHLLLEFIRSNNNRDINLTRSAVNNLKHNIKHEVGYSPNSKLNIKDREERKVFKSKNQRKFRIDEVLNGNLDIQHYVIALINTMSMHDLNMSEASVSYIFTYYLHNLTTVQQEKGLIELIASVVGAITSYDYKSRISSLIFEVVYRFLVLNNEVDQAKLATFLLHLNLKCHSELVTKITVEVGKILQRKTLAPQSIAFEEKEVIFNCFCILRQTKKTHRLKEINLEEYTRYFDFIVMIDQEEQRQRIIKHTLLLLVFLLLLASITLDGHHKSATLKKYLSLKYEYDDLALYLLWCSGDVEINPGPTFSKIRPLFPCEKERKWICEVCSVLVKLVKELPLTSKPKSLWTQKPKHWTKGEPFFDPNNISKVQSGALLSKERLLKNLTTCCVANEKTVPDSYQIEINLFEDDNKLLLFETCIFRKEKHNICIALSNLLMFKDRGEIINQDMKNCGLTLNFGLTQTSQHSEHTGKKETITEVRRDLAVLLSKIIKCRPIHEKCDKLWEKPPTGWSLLPELFYNPHNKKKRQGICPDKELVNNLIKYCNDQSNSVEIPSKYQVMVTAWTEGNIDELIKIHTIYANITKLEHALKYLQVEGILAKPDSLDFLEKQGLTLDTDIWKLKDRQKDGNHTANREQSQRLIGNPLTSEEIAIKKSSSCNKRDTKLQKLSTPQQATELYENILLPSTDESRTVDAEPLSPESPSTSEELTIKKSSSCNKRDTKLQKQSTPKQTAELYENTLLPSTDESKTASAEPFSPESSFKKKPQLKLSGSEERSSQKRRLDTYTFDQEEHEEKKKQKLNKFLYETSLTQEEEDKLKRQLDEPVPPLSEETKKCCPADLEYSDVDNMINDFMKSEQAEDLENFINIDY